MRLRFSGPRFLWDRYPPETLGLVVRFIWPKEWNDLLLEFRFTLGRLRFVFYVCHGEERR